MVNRETQCSKHWFGLTRLWILTLEPERLKNRRATACDESREGWGSQQTLKLLVVSDVQPGGPGSFFQGHVQTAAQSMEKLEDRLSFSLQGWFPSPSFAAESRTATEIVA